MSLSKTKITLSLLLLVFTLGFIYPENLTIPVEKATRADWNKDSFWYEPWGVSVTHKGIDIFAKKGTPALSASDGLMLYSGELKYGGKVVIILGPKWRIHYYAHLESITVSGFSLVKSADSIGSVGNTGNAIGKPAHLHYSIITLLPYLWRMDFSTQGWKKAFYLDPSKKLNH